MAMDRMGPHVVIGTVGLPYAGKSSWARRQGYPIVNPDSVRLALHGQRYLESVEPLVWWHVSVMIEALLRAGHQYVIVDATNTTRKRRGGLIDSVRGIQGEPRRLLTFAWKVIPTSWAECRERARRADDDEIVPVIERMARSLEWPDPAVETIYRGPYGGPERADASSRTVERMKDGEEIRERAIDGAARVEP